ncbi:hypothetical protein AVEN_144972-1 [Araneus ventricosus]|uniref:Uncharacterized protein n=1 Tax=Araneus ventricosus TaxID=182803 RepID=A0A4Y2UUN7_ARAVE|nr:hypothetical protein AVEN_144972-1 [Araneus ventricosus]
MCFKKTFADQDDSEFEETTYGTDSEFTPRLGLRNGEDMSRWQIYSRLGLRNGGRHVRWQFTPTWITEGRHLKMENLHSGGLPIDLGRDLMKICTLLQFTVFQKRYLMKNQNQKLLILQMCGLF